MPILKFDALGGQFFYEGDNTSFSGNGNLVFSPGVKFSDKNMLVPTLVSQYRRTREVRDLIGGGFLTQESLDTAVTVKWIHQFGERWAVKPNVSYKNELITESKDEVLGNGLFDYHKVSAGLEAERRVERFNLRQAATVYGVRFYHYRALAATQQDLGAEIKAGDRVLDFNAYDYSIAAEVLAREGTVLSGSLLGSYRPFRDQKVVNVTGTYLDKNRYDLYGLGLLGVQQKLPPWRLGPVAAENLSALGLAYTLMFSNQASYDASRTKFNPDYYDYWELSGGPSYSARFNKKLAASVAYNFTRRKYHRRPVQETDGSYAREAVYLHTHTVSWQFAYPLTKSLSLKTLGSYRLSASNMRYEKTYRYNYESAHYFVGFGFSL